MEILIIKQIPLFFLRHPVKLLVLTLKQPNLVLYWYITTLLTVEIMCFILITTPHASVEDQVRIYKVVGGGVGVCGGFVGGVVVVEVDVGGVFSWYAIHYWNR